MSQPHKPQTRAQTQKSLSLSSPIKTWVDIAKKNPSKQIEITLNPLPLISHNRNESQSLKG